MQCRLVTILKSVRFAWLAQKLCSSWSILQFLSPTCTLMTSYEIFTLPRLLDPQSWCNLPLKARCLRPYPHSVHLNTRERFVSAYQDSALIQHVICAICRELQANLDEREQFKVQLDRKADALEMERISRKLQVRHPFPCHLEVVKSMWWCMCWCAGFLRCSKCIMFIHALVRLFISPSKRHL